jgi:Ran GTPase-activating protein (RanGAP) involved in mRNA processing and transport
MRFADIKKFSISIGELDYLLNISLQGNFVDDEMMKWFSTGLITNHTLRYLDLSNNHLTENG